MIKIYSTLFGSRLYGTHTDASDYDYRGVYVYEPLDILGLTLPRESFSIAGEDTTFWSLQHFCRTVHKSPTMTEVLWAGLDHAKIHLTAWQKIYDIRQAFLTHHYILALGGFIRSDIITIDTKELTAEHAHYKYVAEFGYDTKAAANVYRLWRMMQIAVERQVVSPVLSLADVSRVLAIKRGNLSKENWTELSREISAYADYQCQNPVLPRERDDEVIERAMLQACLPYMKENEERLLD